ncbi:hypothetical protein PRK78_001628 [Emydomyces testavorans]|uniref:DUF6604 domain-containing protein n=1 Tax=Emydomyces testavorans TaxID=2070801 RepID=A0AAF0DCT8_9EURO|nr:hypothetical protein PRK78_001628 [Emydomyces testavorans]
MAGHNTYLKYKRDQKLLVYWIIHTSNRIVKLFPSERSPPANTTGQISLSTLVSLSQLIAKHINPIPATIYRLFRSIIAARQEIHAIFRQLVAKHPDPETEKSNVSHKHWIDGLTEALKALGGELWISEQKNEIKGADEEDEEDEEEAIFTNIFSALRLDGEEVDEDDEVNAEEETKGPSIPAAPARRKKKPTRRGKKGKRGRKPKGKPESADSAARLDEVPLEAYRIIEDESGLVTDYLMAVYSLITQLIELRYYLQSE